MIHTEKEYEVIVERIETLLQNRENIENTEAKDYILLNILSDLVAEYEECIYPIR
jgi:HTH-type transcriptional regulator/antitoxin HigA